MIINSEGLIEMGHNPDKIKSIISYNSDRSQNNGDNVSANVSGDSGVRSIGADNQAAPIPPQETNDFNHFYILRFFSTCYSNNGRATPLPVSNNPRLDEAYQYYINNTQSPQITN